jgi:hypothetical protein
MSEDLVERIPDRDSRGTKWAIGLFFLLFPFLGVVMFWFDGHARLERESVAFVRDHVVSAWRNEDLPMMLELSTPELADELRNGRAESLQQELGALQLAERFDADKTRAREVDDQGVIYASVDFQAVFSKGNARVTLGVERNSTSTEWMVNSVKVTKR